MDYSKFSLDELKNIAKEKGITVGNIKKDKLIDKIEKFDLENNTKSLIDGTDIIDDIEKEDIVEDKLDSPNKENIVESITDIISDLDDYEDSEERDETLEDIGMEEEVPCMSITFGELIYTSNITGATYKWQKIGDVEYLTMKELTSMNNSKPIFLNRPWLILQDVRAINHFSLMSKYEDVAKINQLKKLFASGNTKLITETVDSALKAGMRDVLISKIRTMYNNKVLNNTHIIKLLQEQIRFDIDID